jgi:hypothetical protein
MTNNGIAISPNGTGNTYITSGNFGVGTTAPGALLDIGLAGTSLGVIRLSGSTSGNVSLEPNAIAGTNIVLTLPATSGTVALTSQISGTNSGTNTGDQTNISGNAATATNVAYSGLTGTVPTWNQNTTGSSATLTTPRTIAGVSFNGGTDIAIASTNLSDTTNVARLNAANVFTNSGNTSFAGNVGLGTTNPQSKLDIAYDATNATGIRIVPGYDGSSIQMRGTPNSVGWYHSNIITGRDSPTAVYASYLAFSTENKSSGTTDTSTEKMRILGNGNVGIGTTNPRNQLEIMGPNTYSASIRFALGPNYPTYYSEMGFLTGQGSSITEFRATAGGTSTVAMEYDAGGNVHIPSGKLAIGATDPGTAKLYVNGNVGIGTTSPGGVSLPNGFGTSGKVLEILTSGAQGSAGLLLRGFSTAYGLELWNSGNGTGYIDLTNSGNLHFRSNTQGTPVTNMTILGNGNVGIGTTSPTELLHLSTKSSYNIPIYLNMTSDRFGGGSLPIGGIKFKNAQNEYEIARIEVTNSAAWEADAGVLNFMTRPAGGTLTQRMRIDNAGSVSINSLASCGGIQTNGSGTMSCTSDARLKDIKGSFTQGLDAINKINPETYSWKQDSGLYDNGILYSGFIAQNIEQAIPEAVNYNAAGYRQVNTTTILATTINAIKELDLKVNDLSSLDITSATSLGSLIKSFLADATNGIGDFFANRVRTKELCISDATGETCLTRSQIDSLITKPSGDNTSSSSPTQAELDAQKLIDDKAALDAKAKLDQAALDAQAVLDQATADAKAKAITDAAAQAEIDAQKLKDTQAAAQKLIDDQVAAEAAAKAAQAAAGAKAKAAADAAL